MDAIRILIPSLPFFLIFLLWLKKNFSVDVVRSQLSCLIQGPVIDGICLTRNLLILKLTVRTVFECHSFLKV
jgi:hypothetical protein